MKAREKRRRRQRRKENRIERWRSAARWNEQVAFKILTERIEDGTVRIWTADELLAEKPKGELVWRDPDAKLWRLFSCHGCQTCWVYTEDPSGDWEKDTVVQDYPHFLSMDEIPGISVHDTPESWLDAYNAAAKK